MTSTIVRDFECIFFHCKWKIRRADTRDFMLGDQCIGQLCDLHAEMIGAQLVDGDYVFDIERYSDGFLLIPVIHRDTARLSLVAPGVVHPLDPAMHKG